MQVFDSQRKIFSALAFAGILVVAADLPLVISTQASAAAPCDPGSHYREAKLMLPVTQIATAATSPALTNAPDTTTALNRITPSAYAILSSAHLITPTKRPSTQ